MRCDMSIIGFRRKCVRARSVGLLAVMLASACSGNDATSPSGQAEAFTWTVNGQTFAASANGRAALQVGGNLSLTGGNCGTGAFMSILVRGAGVGAFRVSNDQATVQWTPDAKTSTAALEAWQAPGLPRVVGNALVSGGSGSVSITSMTADWVEGSFTAELVANPNNRDPSPRTVQGTFQLPIRDRRVC